MNLIRNCGIARSTSCEPSIGCERHFSLVAVGLLVITAGLKLLSVWSGSRVLELTDAVFQLDYRILLVITGVLELFIAGWVYFATTPFRRGLPILWLAMNFVLYKALIALLGFKACPCLGALTDWIGVDSNQSAFWSNLILVYLLCTGIFSIWSGLRTSAGLNSRLDSI